MTGATAPLLFGLPMNYVVIGVALLVFALAIPVVMGLSSPQQRMRKQASKLQKRVKDKSTFEARTEKVKSLRREDGDTSLPFFTRLLNRSSIGAALRDRVARSGFKMSAERYVLYNGVLFLVVTLLFAVVLHSSIILSVLIGIIIGFGLPNFIVGFRINRSTRRFLILFPDAIDLIVRGLRAGLPVTESIKMVAKEIDDPVRQIFRTMSEKMALGVPLEKTLYETAAKYRITEFDFFVTSIVLQRETGGNLSEILNNLSEALRQRLMMRMKIKAMSSEAKASMYIIGALPFAVSIALFFTTPEYLGVLINDFRGNIALFIAVCMLSSGMYIMSRMAKFEI